MFFLLRGNFIKGTAYSGKKSLPWRGAHSEACCEGQCGPEGEVAECALPNKVSFPYYANRDR